MRRIKPKQFLDVISDKDLKVCRALLYSRWGYPGRELARRAGINHETCRQSVMKLEELRILRIIGYGRTQLISFNPGNYMADEILIPTLIKEREYINRMEKKLNKP